MTKHIIPRYKLIIYYDLHGGPTEEYYQFVMRDMIPAAQEMGMYMYRVFHTLWGDCPLRQAEFVAEDLLTAQEMLASERWHELEDSLQQYATNYRRKLVKFRPGFQL